MIKLGFIGAGNMAGAILQGAIGSGFVDAHNVCLYDVNAAQLAKWTEKYPVQAANDNVALVQACEYIVLAVKPIYLRGVLEEIRPHINGKRVISIAAGWTMGMLTSILDAESDAQVLRVMPNTPALVGEGFTALCAEHTMGEEAFTWARQLFETMGKVEVFPERLFDGVIAVSGSSPAYVYMMIEAMADGAVKLGLPRNVAYRAAAQAMLGAAKMVLETGEHPAKLKDDVCSPGGTTIEAVYALEKNGFRGAVMSAMEACAQRSRELAEE